MQPGGSGPSIMTTPFSSEWTISWPVALVDQLDVVAVHRQARRAELAGQRFDAIAQAQDRPAGLGLPVVVDDRPAQRFGDPGRRRLVQRLAGQEQRAQARQVVLLQVGRVLLLQHAHRGGRAEHRGDLVLLDQAPPDAGIGADRQAFVHDRRHAGDQRAIDDVAVAHHPADVAGGEVGLARLAQVDVLHARGQRDAVAAGVALHALGRAGGAAGVQRVARVRGIHPFAGHLRVHVLAAQRGVVLVAPGRALELRQAAVDHQHLGRLALGQLDGLVEQALVGHHLAGRGCRRRR